MSDDIKLGNLYNYRKNNERYIQELIAFIKENKVIPFIGAGMSFGIYPTRKQFFESILKSGNIRPSDQTAIKQLLIESEYEKAVSVYYNSVGRGIFIDTIKHLFSDKKISKEKYSNMPIHLLPSIFKQTTVITTNYDRLLEAVYSDEHYPFKGCFTPYEDSKVVLEEFALGSAHYLLKLNGDYMTTDSIVFTEEQYNIRYRESFNSEYVKFLGEVLSSRVLLFLGCSLSMDRNYKLLKKIDILKEREHYAILETPEDQLEDVFYDKVKELSDMGIKVIWYPKGKHEYVSLMLTEIKEKVLQKTDEINVQVITNTLVQRPSKDFIGRMDEIKAIRESLDQGKKLVLVSTVGGLGKTQICSTIYYQYLDEPMGEISHLGWVTYDVDLKTSLFKRFRDICGAEDNSDYFRRSIEYLNDLGKKLLLFIDNVNNITLEEQEIISSLSCKVIMTSRCNDLRNAFHLIKIEQLSEKECLLLYRYNAYENVKEELDVEELEAVRELVHKTDRNSVAIILLAKTQREANISATKLLQGVIESDFKLSNIVEPIRYKNKEDIFIMH